VSSEIIWSILGVSASVIFGLIGVYLTVKSRYPGKITFVNEQTIELFDSIGNSLDSLAVSYGGEQVNENLVLLNGAFINSGKTDITKDMVEKPITLELPDGYKWLTGKVVKSNIDAELNLIDDNTISISTGLFRCGEYVRFHALAQLPENTDDVSNSKKLKESIGFHHRITNTRKIDETEVQPLSASKKELKRRGVPFTILLLVMLGVFGFSLYSGLPKSMVYKYSVSNDVIESVTVKIRSGDVVEVSSIDTDFEVEEPFDDFMSKVHGAPSLGEPKGYIELFFIAALQFLLLGGMLCMLLFDFTKNRRLLRIIDEQ
jgi:hypothetical protein